MKRKTVIQFCVIIMLVFCCHASFAQQIPDNNWGIGARLSYYAPDDTTIEGSKFDPDEGILFEGNLTWFPMKWLSLEFAAGYTETDVKLEEFPLSVDFGELEQIPLLLTGRLHWWNSDSRFTLYGGGGIGYYFNDFSLSGLVRSVEPGLSVDADDSFGFHLSGGLEWFVTPAWALNLDLKYVWNEADFDSRDAGAPPETVEIDLDAFVVGIGVKYYF
ncbi:OmpW family protein [Thermodesulfobacteriota bacterium]